MPSLLHLAFLLLLPQQEYFYALRSRTFWLTDFDFGKHLPEILLKLLEGCSLESLDQQASSFTQMLFCQP
jgi:hypothetical protein